MIYGWNFREVLPVNFGKKEIISTFGFGFFFRVLQHDTTGVKQKKVTIILKG